MIKRIDFQSGIVQAPLVNLRERLILKLYVEDLVEILSLPVGCKELLYELLQLNNKNGIIALTRKIKFPIIQRLDITIGTLDNYLSALVKAGVFIRIGRGKFKVNPNLFVKESLANKLKLSITYFPSGERKIQLQEFRRKR
jgi:Firmicute plasmid replication protein (RepL)